MSESLGQFNLLMEEAYYSPWFLLTLVLSCLILLPAGYFRCCFVFWGIPVAFVASWAGFFIGCRAVSAEHSIIEGRFNTWASDTGLTFAPIIYGVPIAAAVTAVVAATSIGLFSRPSKIEPEFVQPQELDYHVETSEGTLE